jgi:SAM-dependent methyltransferase
VAELREMLPRNQVVGSVDRESLRYQAFCADRLIQLLAPASGNRLLDLAAGSGTATLSASQAVSPGGRVTAIDLSESMLALLEAKVVKFGIDNVDIHLMDRPTLDFRRNYFDRAVCCLGLDRFPDSESIVAETWRVLRPGGSFACSSLAVDVFRPQIDRLRRLLATKTRVSSDVPGATMGTSQALGDVMGAAGFVGIETYEINFGYHLNRVEQWWEVVEHSPLRVWMLQLNAAEKQEVRTRHLEEIATGIGCHASPGSIRPWQSFKSPATSARCTYSGAGPRAAPVRRPVSGCFPKSSL